VEGMLLPNSRRSSHGSLPVTFGVEEMPLPRRRLA